jgi:glucose uptake protein GlcU
MAQRKWHLLAISGGMIWGIGQVSANMAMVDIGVSIGAPSIQGLVIVVGVVWGLVVFKELKDIPVLQRKRAKLILGFGCAFALLGSIVMGFVASLLF